MRSWSWNGAGDRGRHAQRTAGSWWCLCALGRAPKRSGSGLIAGAVERIEAMFAIRPLLPNAPRLRERMTALTICSTFRDFHIECFPCTGPARLFWGARSQSRGHDHGHRGRGKRQTSLLSAIALRQKSRARRTPPRPWPATGCGQARSPGSGRAHWLRSAPAAWPRA